MLWCQRFTVSGFEWDDHNIEHIARHGVEFWEAEEAVLDPRRTGKTVYGGRRGLIGATEDGRLLVVIYEFRGQRIRAITARDASAREGKSYRRRSR